MSEETSPPGPNPFADTRLDPLTDGSRSDRDRAELAPGEVVAGRFRIERLLGRGGMGAVWLAHDTALQQDVALKAVGGTDLDERRRAEVLRTVSQEVRYARQVSHPSICRVHDLIEDGDRLLITMEAIDGENLATLLRRVGRLSGDKAAQVSRQLCSGLHAAHEKGVLHRDLKPANVMLDEHGDAKLTDFGIAGPLNAAGGEETLSGTPAYMAPELFEPEGRATRASDIYALGLLLHEIWVGRPVYEVRSWTELLRRHQQGSVPQPPVLPEGAPPSVARAIAQCLHPDPRQRPRSALHVLARLPGGDPLGEALAAGTTPSPDLVAEAQGPGRLTQRGALAAVLGCVVLWITHAFAGHSAGLLESSRLPLPPEVLADRARQLMDALEHSEAGLGPEAIGFVGDREGIPVDESADTPAIAFFLRAAPPGTMLLPRDVKGRVRWHDPDPAAVPGSVQAMLFPDGRLVRWLEVPPRALDVAPAAVDASLAEDAAASRLDRELDALFEAAGVDRSGLREIAALRRPPVYAERLHAWQAVGTDGTPGEMFEAASTADDVVWFARSDDAIAVAAEKPIGPPTWRWIARVLMLVGAGVLVWHNAQSGQSDARGALRLGGFTVASVLLFSVLIADHSAHGWSAGALSRLLVEALGHGLAVGGSLAFYYYGFERHARRTWPQSMVAWSRLLQGGWRDPQVGVSLLVGAFFGLLAVLVLDLRVLGLEQVVGRELPPTLRSHPDETLALLGTVRGFGLVVELLVDMGHEALKLFLSALLLKLLLRRDLLAAPVVVLLWAAIWTTQDPTRGTAAGLAMALAASITVLSINMVILVRYGLLALVAGYFTFGIAVVFPARPPGHWNAEATYLSALVIAVLVVHGWRCTALGARRGIPGFGRALPATTR